MKDKRQKMTWPPAAALSSAASIVSDPNFVNAYVLATAALHYPYSILPHPPSPFGPTPLSGGPFGHHPYYASLGLQRAAAAYRPYSTPTPFATARRESVPDVRWSRDPTETPTIRLDSLTNQDARIRRHVTNAMTSQYWNDSGLKPRQLRHYHSPPPPCAPTEAVTSYCVDLRVNMNGPISPAPARGRQVAVTPTLFRPFGDDVVTR